MAFLYLETVSVTSGFASKGQKRLEELTYFLVDFGWMIDDTVYFDHMVPLT